MGQTDEHFFQVKVSNASSALGGAELVCVEHFKNKGRVASVKHALAFSTTRVCFLQYRLVKGEEENAKKCGNKMY